MDRHDRIRTEPAGWHPTPSSPDCPYCREGERNPSASAFDWSFVEAAYCISLRERPDRAAAAAAEFHRVGLCARVTFFRPTKPAGSVRIAIWESHRMVAEHALRHGRAPVLVLEDDVVFSKRLQPAAVRALGESMATLPRDWMILYLGHWPLWGYFVRRNLLRCGSACCHAYVASERTLSWLRDQPPDSVPVARIAGRGVDAAFARLPETYAIFPMLAIQRPGRSDNLGASKSRRKRKLKHLITRSRYRELLLSRLMRPSELWVAALSPIFFVLHCRWWPRSTRP